MRHGNFWAVLATIVLAGCTSPKTLEDMVGYVPPTSLPAQPKRTLVADDVALVWTELVDFLETSAFEVDHINEEQRLLIARYSGDPEPYIDCGSIVTHQGGTLGQVSGSAPTVALNYKLDEEAVVLNRTLNLDSRIIIRLTAQSQGTVIETDTTYVVTKTVDVADRSGGVTRGSRESVSFEAGRRGEFSKGTACQPNGSLDLAVLKSLPNVVGSDEIDRAELPASSAAAAAEVLRNSEVDVALTTSQDPEQPAISDEGIDDIEPEAGAGQQVDVSAVPRTESTAFDWVLPEQGLPSAALPTPQRTLTPDPVSTTLDQEDSQPRQTDAIPAPSLENDDKSESAAAGTVALATEGSSEGVASPDRIVDDTTRKLLESLDCRGDEWHFCDLVRLTTPYRKRNTEKLFGLTINTSESFTSQIVGRDLKLDILFPSFPSYMHIAYARRDGMIEHVVSSEDVWPADLAHQFSEADQRIPGPDGLAMIIAIATDRPLFSSAPDNAEDAATYLDQLKQRLSELEASNAGGPIAASQLLIYVENADT